MWWFLSAAVAAEPDWKELFAESATASSFLESNWNKYTENYHPNYALDRNPATAWVEGVEGNGEGQWIEIPLSSLRSARAVKLHIWNGYQKSGKLLAANAAPKGIVVEARYRGATVGSLTSALNATAGAQELIIPVQGGLDAVRLTIASVTPGKTYKDTCISDIQVFVDSDVAYNPTFETAKHSRLQAWVGERVTTAQYFAAQPPEYPFASSHFIDSEFAGPPPEERERQRLTLRQQLDATLQSAKLFRADRKKKSAPLPDGVHLPAAIVPFLTPSEISWFEATDRTMVKRVDEHPYAEESTTTWTTPPQVVFRDDGSPERLAFELKAVEDGRATTATTVTRTLLTYADGRLQQYYEIGEQSYDLGDGLETFQVELLGTFSYDDQGKVRQIDQLRFDGLPEPDAWGASRSIAVTSDGM